MGTVRIPVEDLAEVPHPVLENRPDARRRGGRVARAVRDVRYPLLLGTVTLLAILLGYQAVGFSVVTSDVAAYIAWSYNLTEHASYESHMPGFPAMILAARRLTAGWVPDAVAARMICFVFWAISVVLANELLRAWAPRVRSLGVLCFALAPLVGVTYVALPTTECIARAFLAGALLTALRRQWNLFLPIVAAGLFIHQAYYPVYFLLALACVVTRGMHWGYMIASGIPFVAYYTYVAFAHSDPAWILTGHQRMHLHHGEADYLLFNGILQGLSAGDVPSFAKGFLASAVTVLALGLLFYSVRSREWMFVALTAPIVVASAMAAPNVVFIVVRLSPLLIFPLCYVAERVQGLPLMLQFRGVRAGAAACLAASQFAWAAYLCHYLAA